MITRDQAWKLLIEKMQNQNLRRHCLSVEAVMRALAKHFGVSPSAVQLIFCRASLQKIFEINTN